MVAAHAVGHEPRRALIGLRSGRSIRQLRRTRLGCGVAVPRRAVAVRLGGAGFQTPRRRTWEISAVLGLGSRAGPGAVTGCGRREDALAAGGLGADVAVAHLAAGTGPVAVAVVATRLGGSLVRAGVVGILPAADSGAGTIGLAGERLLAGIASGAGVVAADTVYAVSTGTVPSNQARHADR